MKIPLIASVTAKVAAGVAGVALLTGGAGTVLSLQPAGEQSRSTAAEAAEETTTTTSTTTTSTTSTTVAPTTTTSTTAVEDASDTSDLDERRTVTHERADNFGASVSEDARDGGVDGREISARARARNEARRAERGEDTHGDADDDASPAAAHRKDDRPGKS